jgi:triosephosphate isomerase
MRAPVVIINFKAYAEVQGDRAVALAEACQDVSDETGVIIAVSPPATELSSVSRAVTVPVFAQHIDARRPGAVTGHITPELARAAGATGTLLNHSERRMVLADLALGVQLCKGAGLITCVCTDTRATSAAAASLEPDLIAVEPPELIGGDVSVTDANPQIVSDAVNAVHRIDQEIQVLCGAGIKNGRDVQKAIELGAAGVLLASGVVKAKEPRKVLADLVQFL